MTSFAHKFHLVAGIALVTLLCSCGGAGGEEDDLSSTPTAAGSGSACSATFKDILNYSSKRSANAGNAQCLTTLDAAEALRQNAVANCQAGNNAAANTIYSNYQKYPQILATLCK